MGIAGNFRKFKHKSMMKKLLLFFCLGISIFSLAQTGKSKTSPLDERRQFFYKLDDEFNLAMVTKDSLFFVNHFADSFINCTPRGEVNSKSEEISTLLGLPFVNVERAASKYDIFTCSDKVATISVIKKITKKDSSIDYIRRTIIYEHIDGKWLIVSGQGTRVLPKLLRTICQDLCFCLK